MNISLLISSFLPYFYHFNVIFGNLESKNAKIFALRAYLPLLCYNFDSEARKMPQKLSKNREEMSLEKWEGGGNNEDFSPEYIPMQRSKLLAYSFFVKTLKNSSI